MLNLDLDDIEFFFRDSGDYETREIDTVYKEVKIDREGRKFTVTPNPEDRIDKGNMYEELVVKTFSDEPDIEVSIFQNKPLKTEGKMSEGEASKLIKNVAPSTCKLNDIYNRDGHQWADVICEKDFTFSTYGMDELGDIKAKIDELSDDLYDIGLGKIEKAI